MTRRAYCSKCRRFIDIPDSRSGPSDNTYGISCPNCQASWEHLTVQRLRVNLPGVVASIAVPIGFMLLINPPNLGVLFLMYFLPSLVLIVRKGWTDESRLWIGLNVFAGWTVAAWFMALMVAWSD